MQLINSQTFQNEYQKFLEKISKISDDTTKAELSGLLKQLILEVKRLDQEHTGLIGQNSLSSNATDVRGSIQSLRKKISTKISECERSGFIK